MARLVSGRSSEVFSSVHTVGSMPSTNRLRSKPGLETSESTAPLAERVLGDALQAHVDGEHHVAAGLRRRGLQRADAAAGGVDLDLLEAGGAGQLALVEIGRAAGRGRG